MNLEFQPDEIDPDSPNYPGFTEAEIADQRRRAAEALELLRKLQDGVGFDLADDNEWDDDDDEWDDGEYDDGEYDDQWAIGWDAGYDEGMRFNSIRARKARMLIWIRNQPRRLWLKLRLWIDRARGFPDIPF